MTISIILTVCTLGYFLPWMVAALRAKSNTWAILGGQRQEAKVVGTLIGMSERSISRTAAGTPRTSVARWPGAWSAVPKGSPSGDARKVRLRATDAGRRRKRRSRAS